MNENEQQIRKLVEDWAAAVHRGDMDQVLHAHTDDIVMFDVPPPDQGVRGIDQYRDTWPPFFDWQANGGSFEIVEMDVTAGDQVAFVFALVICNSEEGRIENPDRRLRLTLGLRKEGDDWLVCHEHHSFPLE